MKYLHMFLLPFIIAFVFHTSPTQAQSFDLQSFANIPIQHEGRIKPMSSFSSAMQKYLSGHEQYPVRWLAETLFNPSYSETKPVLKITNPDVLNMLGLERANNKLFTYQDIMYALSRQQNIILTLLKTPRENWTPAQRDLIDLQERTVIYGKLLGSMSLFLPLSITLPNDVPNDLKPFSGKRLTYIETLRFRKSLDTHVRSLTKKKGADPERYTDQERALARLLYSIDNLRMHNENNDLVRLLPQSNSQTWDAPWSLVSQGSGTPSTSILLDTWKTLAHNYHQKDQQKFANTARKIIAETKALDHNNAVNEHILKTETLYNRLKPFHVSTAFYALAILLAFGARFIDYSWILRSAVHALSIGIICHALGILARMYILMRPPVSTLYESIIFVGLITAIYGVWHYQSNKNTIGLVLGASAGIILHILGFSHDQDGDSLLMLTAVLNTNFWLATHVICITTGYAFCLLGSVLGHIHLVKTVNDKQDKSLFKHMHTIALIALLFATVGTVLGGIWADQSWGRFWGWDPKENGALLIVLWIAWILHGRISGYMNTMWFSAGLAYLSVIVFLSWFGVNLLGVGLHSYGFTDSEVWGLALFTTIDTTFIGGCLWHIHHRQDQIHAH